MNTNPTTTRRRPLRTVALTLAALGLVTTTAACSSDGDTASTTTTKAETTTTAAVATGVTASGAWARQSPMVAGAGAAYMTLTGGPTADELVSASVPAEIAGTVELHETTMSDDAMGEGDMSGEMGSDMGSDMGGSGMMSMKQVASIPVPANGTVELKPGGYHIMLIDLAAPLVPGEGFDVTLTFSSGETLVVPVEVRAA